MSGPLATLWGTCPACLRSISGRCCPGLRYNTIIRTSISPQFSSVQRHRSIHTSPVCNENQTDSRQAQRLGDFYLDLLNTPTPKSSASHDATPSESLPTFVQAGKDKSKQERAAMLFGNIQGSGYERSVSDRPDATWRTVNGVPVPPRPSEPENCCMSGCVHCVWDDYRDDVEQWAARVHEAQSKADRSRPSGTTTPKVDMPRPEVASSSTSMDDDGGGSEALWTTSSSNDDGDALFQGIPVGIREFMATEKRIRERKRERKQSPT